MNRTQKLKVSVDTAMVLLLPLLMAYSLIGELPHELMGLAMAVLFIAHHVLNFGWYKGLLKGKYTWRRALSTAVNLLLGLCMLLQMVSGILVSRHLFTFLPLSDGAAAGRTIHLLCAYWGFLLMSAHLGLHAGVLSARMGLNGGGKRSGAVRKALSIIFLLVSAWGIYAFFRRKLAEYLFLRTAFVFFDYSEPVVFFLADYIAIMVLFATLFYYLTKPRRNHAHEHAAKVNESSLPADGVYPGRRPGRAEDVRSGSEGTHNMKYECNSSRADVRKSPSGKKTAGNPKRRKILPAVLAGIIVIGGILFVTMGLPYIRRHFIPVKVDRPQAAAMAAIDARDRKILTVQFTRVGNTDFADDVDAVSSASLMLDTTVESAVRNDALVGNAELIAQMIQNAVGGDLYAIRTESRYPSSYADTCRVALQELNSGNELPLAGALPDTSGYDTVFLVYPIWWGTVPEAVKTFLAHTDLSGAEIYTVITHGGSKEGRCISDMASMTEGKISGQFLTVYDDDAAKSGGRVAEWLRSVLN